MQVKVQDIASIIEEIAPLSLACEWDNVGLQVGSPKDKVKNVLITLDVTDEVIKESIEKQIDLIVSHHPLIFEPIKKLDKRDPVAQKLNQLIKKEISLYVAHTNLDQAEQGVNEILADLLELENREPLVPSKITKKLKLVVFVPEAELSKVRAAICDAGGGEIGNYVHCTYQTKGFGTFKPLEGASPSVGDKDRINKVDEYRLEVLVPENRLDEVIEVMAKSHPYEEVAFDVYPILNILSSSSGLGRVGNLRNPLPVNKLIKKWEKKLNTTFEKTLGDLKKEIARLAICAGSGKDFIKTAKEKGAQLLITGDITYHAALEAKSIGLFVIDAGHDITERVVLPKLSEMISKRIREQDLAAKVMISAVDTNPWNQRKNKK